MDTLIFKSSWIRTLLAKLISSAIKKKTGKEMIFSIKELSGTTDGEMIIVEFSGVVKMKKSEFETFVKGLV